MVRHQGDDAYSAATDWLTRPGVDDVIVVVVGPACRTWYKDVERLRLVLSDLFEVRPFSVLHGGKYPFDMYVDRLCTELHIPSYLSGPPKEVRLSEKYARDADLAYGALMVIAFPAEEPSHGEGPRARGKHFPPESADLEVIRGAREHGVPVLSIYRDGWALWEGV